MLKKSPQGFSKDVLSMLLTLTLCVSCTKGYDPGILLNDKSTLLTGQPDLVNWSLKSIQVNTMIDTSGKGAIKVYRPDGTFTDNLGFTGYWTLYAKDSLMESTRSSIDPNAPYFTNRFHIDRLDRGRLQLTYAESDKKIKLIYDANK